MSIKDSSLYTLEEINGFLDEMFGKQVNIKEFFPDVDKFERSVAFLQKTMNLDQLSETKLFRLKKHITVIRKSRRVDKKKRLKASCKWLAMHYMAILSFFLLLSLLYPS